MAEPHLKEDPAPKSAKIWFGPKTIGYGWGPVSWEGWLLVAGIVLLPVVAIRLVAYIFTGRWDLGAAIIIIVIADFAAFHLLSRKHMSPDIDSGT